MKVYIVLIVLLLAIAGCADKKPSSNIISKEKVIKIPDSMDTLTPQDSLFSSIDIVPLETNDNCLIKEVTSFKIRDSLIYIKSRDENLYVFDLTGNFRYKISSKGQGPGEYIEIRDFLFTKDGNLEILDFKKIETYTLDGRHIGTKHFDFLGKDLYCNAVNFAQAPASGYYLWGGAVGIRSDEKLRAKSYMMHHVSNDMHILNSYFPVGNGDGGTKNRFNYYNDTILLAPYTSAYDIYQIDNKGDISVRYSIDFGKYSILNNLDSPDERIDPSVISIDKYVLNLSDYVESDNWVHVRFSYGNLAYQLLYSKTKHLSYLLSMAKPTDNELRFYPVSQVYEDKFVTAIDAYWLLGELDRVTPEGQKKWNIAKYKSLSETDNPVLIFYTLK
ncbi:6-bladed beta-propeller [Viscerimonas tarda]